MLRSRCLHLARHAGKSVLDGRYAQHLANLAVEDAPGTPARRVPDGPNLRDFLQGPSPCSSHRSKVVHDGIDAIEDTESYAGKKVFIETYGCQMNVSDSEVVMSVLSSHGFSEVSTPDDANLVLLNTCAIRDKAERKVWNRLVTFRKLKNHARDERRPVPIVGVLGCMAERLKHELLDVERLADLVVGPDAYRDLPRLIDIVQDGEAAINTQLSLEETYADIVPLRPVGNVRAFLSIMRGCNNMCSFCIVPFTRGRERSRPVDSILAEIEHLRDAGFKEVVLLGQNVNSYADFSSPSSRPLPHHPRDPFSAYAEGFKSVYKPSRDGSVQFGELLQRVAEVDPEMRVRFVSPHPKDFSDDVLQVVAEYPNVCNQLHLPAQSGSTTCLERMRRGYSREAFDALVAKTRQIIPGVALSTDIICGFCEETEFEHEETLDLLEKTKFDSGFLFKYSERAKTHAARNLLDDVPEMVKSRRLSQVITTFRKHQLEKAMSEIGRQHLVLVEGASHKSKEMWTGKTDTLKRVVFEHRDVPSSFSSSSTSPVVSIKKGDYIVVSITSASHSTLVAKPVARTTLEEYRKCSVQSR